MKENEIIAILQEDQKEWGALTVILDARPEGVVHGAGPTAWNSRDVYAHLARWLNHSNSYIANALTGKPQMDIDESQADKINQRWQQEDSTLTLTDARHRAYEEFQRRAKLIQSIPLEKWNEEMIRVVYLDGASHYRDHRRYITG